MCCKKTKNNESSENLRYLGNKESLLDEIENLIKDKGLVGKNLTFFDAFSGTAAVSNRMKRDFNIIANDYLYFSYVYSFGRLNYIGDNFKSESIDPFSHFNDDNIGLEGFVTKNYSPLGEEKRQYFSIDNAKKIDYIRSKIEEWKKTQKISDNEYYYLIACLLESVSRVANVAGVYGAYLKKWDPRALKPMSFIDIDSSVDRLSQAELFNEKIEDIIGKIECDVLYLDPPYTKNQYSVQYHILETIAKYDNPEIRGITGARVSRKRKTSDWSREGKAEILLDEIISKTNAKHVILSYSSKGIMSKEFIDSVLKRYGKEETYTFRKFQYKKYRNHQTKSKSTNFEFLFYIELKEKKEVIYNSPLNYIGGKGQMISFLKKNEPADYKKYIDLFGGGFNAGINSSSESIVYNDCNFKVRQLIEMFKNEDAFELHKYLKNNIKKYNLSKNSKEQYLEARKIYNHPEPPLRDPKLLYLLVLYGFNQQIRFNSKLDFNNPVGQSSYNESIFEKLVSFSRVIKEKNIKFYSDDFEELFHIIDKETFIYCDPPYLITLGSYNDGRRGFNGWDEKDEQRLFNFLERADKIGAKFMLSNVLTHKNKSNYLLKEWIKTNNYKVIEYKGNSRNRNEIIIINY